MTERTENPTQPSPALEQPAAPALTDLMASGAPARSAKAKAGPDLAAEAMRAAEAAIAAGERDLAAATAQMQSSTKVVRRGGQRERWLRGLLAFNVLAMLIVAALPTPKGPGDAAADGPPASTTAAPHAPPETTPAPRHKEPYNQALFAADKGEFARAVKLLDDHLRSSPRMAPGQQLNLLMTLAYYSSRTGDFRQAQVYQRRAEAIERSHSLPEDLVAMAKAAVDSGDQEALRRVWARFLLQQRQIPSWLYKHVAEAYLQLGDSYRLQAAAAGETARLEEMEQSIQKLREESIGVGGKQK